MTEVLALADGELKTAIAATSRAFWPDPLFGFFARDHLREHVSIPAFLGAMIADAARHGEVHVVKMRGRVVGSASWIPPGSMPRSAMREMRVYAACARALLTGQNRRTGLALLSAVEKHHPREPHWYLPVLGVDPICQGQGLGGALLSHRISSCDTNGEPIYLETQKPDNVPYYERFGFHVIREVSVPKSPTVWLMWREPRGARE